ncbi:MAG: type VI secretion system baseplate subunit TssG [Gemmataceae bacterium]
MGPRKREFMIHKTSERATPDVVSRQAPPGSLLERLWREPYAFDFFQAVRLLQRWATDKHPVGYSVAPHQEAIRFRAHLSLAFPPSSIHDLEEPSSICPVPRMTVAFLGLYGPNGILPRHYTELLLRVERESRHAEKSALRDWLDLFNHRLISLFYRAWEKYRFYVPYERGGNGSQFVSALLAVVGLGMPALRNRLRVAVRRLDEDEEQVQVVAAVPDLAIVYYSGFFACRRPIPVCLEALVRGYLGLPVAVKPFQGQWLYLEPERQVRLGSGPGGRLGVDVVLGERVWDVESKFRLRIGPLGYRQFREFLPNRAPIPAQKTLFVVAHLVRLYVGPQFDFDIQLVLRAEEVPALVLRAGTDGPRLGWDTWVRSLPMPRDVDDAVFPGEELFWLEAAPAGTDQPNP